MTVSPATIAGQIRRLAGTLAAQVVARQFRQEPQLQQRYGDLGRERCLQDAHFHFMYLASALEYARPALFVDYLGWAKCLLIQRGIPQRDLEANLKNMAAALADTLPAGSSEILREYFERAASQLPAMPEECPSFLLPISPVANLRQRYLQLLLAGKRRDAVQAILDAVQRDELTIETSYLDVFQPVQYEVGRLWQMNRITVAQEHFCTAVTQSVMSQFYPRLFASPRAGRRAVIASVGGDLHEIGGRMVADLLELNGWDTSYLGASTPPEALAPMAGEQDAQVAALSITMTYHLPQLREAIAAIRAEPRCSRARVLVGGRPFLLEPELWREVGADAFARDGREAVVIANELAGTP